jgi:hypothetical protein
MDTALEMPQDIKLIEAENFVNLESLKVKVKDFLLNPETMPNVLRKVLEGTKKESALVIDSLLLWSEGKINISVDVLLGENQFNRVSGVLVDAKDLGFTEEDLKVIKTAQLLRNRKEYRKAVDEKLKRIVDVDNSLRDLNTENAAVS